MKETLRLLVVDDEMGMRMAVERALRSYSCRVEEIDSDVDFVVASAESGEEALEMIDKEQPNLIMLDYKLPGISGIDVLNALGDRKQDIFVVMITAYASLETAVQATKLGAYDFLAKPFTPDELKSVVRKTTRHMLLQRQARKLAQEKKQMRFQLISVVAHELKAPIAAIEGYLYILKDPAIMADASIVSKSVERSLVRLDGMRKLILDLLDLTRIESGQKKRELKDADIAAIARASMETIAPTAADKRVTMEMNCPERLVFRADAGEIEIIFNNLLSNAVKYNRDDGRVTATVEKFGDGVKISVADTGIGMTEEEKSRLFGEFVRIKNKKTKNVMGSGLGLSIVKKLTALYGGSVSVESEPDVGSTFTATLVKAAEEPEEGATD